MLSRTWINAKAVLRFVKNWLCELYDSPKEFFITFLEAVAFAILVLALTFGYYELKDPVFTKKETKEVVPTPKGTTNLF